MNLLLISPDKAEIHHIVWIELFTPNGSFVVQQGHAPMIVTLKPNHSISFLLKTGKQESVSIRHGIAEINRSQVKLIFSS